MQRPAIRFTLFNRVCVVIVCGFLLFIAISGLIDGFLEADFLKAALALSFGACCVAILAIVVRIENISQEEFEAGITAPLQLPNREPIDLDAPNWLVSRFLIQKPRGGPWEFGTVAVDIDANRIHFQNCFCPEAKKSSFLKRGRIFAHHDIDLSEVLQVEVVRIGGDGEQVMQIFTDCGRVFVPEHATHYESQLELLRRIAGYTTKLDLARRPWVEKTIFGIAAVLVLAAIIGISFLLV